MSAAQPETLDRIGDGLRRVRGDPSIAPDGSIVIPVNARADLENVLALLAEVAKYRGKHSFEVVLVINNYPEDEPPAELETFGRAGLRIVGIPSIWRTGEVVSFTARIPGTRAAAAERTVHLDADCRIPHPSALFDWYMEQFEGGAQAAYTHVDYYALRQLWSVRARMRAHHSARWIKRVILRIPTVRGSNYAVNRSLFLRLYDEGLLTDDLNVGPAVKAAGGHIAYSGARDLRVFTSGRRFQGGWLKLARYLRYRLLYNVRVLSIRAGRAGRARNPYHQKPLR